VSAGWVAASVRGRSLARRAIGVDAARDVARADGLDAARRLLDGTLYEAVTVGPGTLGESQRAVLGVLLAQIRLVAGWLPPGGTSLVRTLGAAFERDNVLGHLERLRGRPAPAPYELGALGTGWHRVRVTTSVPALVESLRHTGWGAVDGTDDVALRDALAARWLRRLATSVPAARPWACGAAVLLVARRQVLEGGPVRGDARAALEALLGNRWHAADSVPALRAALDRGLRPVLAGAEVPTDLWHAEITWWNALADDAALWLRRPLPGPEPVVGALGTLTVDAVRVRAALAVAATGEGSAGTAEEWFADAR
jgi:hypothetical protein